MATTTLPTVMDVRNLLGDLLGREVETTLQDGTPGPLDPRACVGVYQDDRHNSVAVITTDLPLSVYLAASLALTSKDAAEEVVKEKALSPAYAENLHEILNVFGTLFNRPGTPPTRLAAMHAPGDPVPPRVASQAAGTGNRLDTTVTIRGYGSGQMSVVI
jgi:hypothetical protein